MGKIITNSISKSIFNNLGETKPIIKIGGENTKFYPQINMSFFGDEFIIDLRRIDKPIMSEIPIEKTDSIEFTTSLDTDIWRIKNGRFKWDIRFDSKPASYEFQWEMGISSGIDYFLQEALIQKEIDRGMQRPDNVINSYAFYCNKANNKYRTGKLFHGYRPYIIDSLGNTAWCELYIESGLMIIILPSDFMETATYPVWLDPDLGYTSAGGSSGNAAQFLDTCNYNNTAGSDGTASNLYVYTKGSGIAHDVYVGYYEDDSGNPGDLGEGNLAISVSSTSPAWYYHSLSGGSITNGNKYYPAIIINPDGGTNNYIYYDSGVGDEDYYKGGQSTMPDPLTGESSGPYIISAYLEFAESGGTVYNMSISESSSITDSIGSLVTLIGSLSEINSISDALISTVEFISSLSESALISDSQSSAIEFISSISENPNISDALISLIDFAGTLNESMSISDQLTNIANLLLSLSESTSIQDTLAAIGNFTISINESATITDAFRVIGAIAKFVKIFGEVELSNKIKGAVKNISKILAEIDKENIIRGEVDDDGN